MSSGERERLDGEMAEYDDVVAKLRPYLDRLELSLLPAAREGYRRAVADGDDPTWTSDEASSPYWGAVFVFQRLDETPWPNGYYDAFDYLPGRSEDYVEPWWPDIEEWRLGRV